MAAKISRAIENYSLTAVCFSAVVRIGPALVHALEQHGLKRSWSSENFVLWAQAEGALSEAPD
ncbi:MAG: hypothetical protein ACI8QZ_001035 [Chlamydiales bacterium]|jgi:hypothetical protein